VDRFSPLPAAVPMWAIGLALFVGLFVGIASGIYPAWKAANQDPIVALGRE